MVSEAPERLILQTFGWSSIVTSLVGVGAIALNKLGVLGADTDDRFVLAATAVFAIGGAQMLARAGRLANDRTLFRTRKGRGTIIALTAAGALSLLLVAPAVALVPQLH